MLCVVVLCVLLLSLNPCSAEGIPSTDARSAAKKFQNALTQQSLQTVLLSIEERLRNLDNVYAMQYSPGVEGKLEMYGRKLESVEAKISRLEAVMGNEMDKISENISSRNFKDDLTRDHVLRKIDSIYERMNHRLIFAQSKMELIERKLENKLDTVLSQMEKMEDSLEIKDADMQGEIADVLTCIDELKTQSATVEEKLVNISKTLNHNAGLLQSEQTPLSLAGENITAAVRRDMKENFEVLSNKMVDFHETSWQTYDRLERTLRGMSLVSNLTRYEIQNGLRSLTVEVGRLSGGQGLLSDSSKEKSKLHEIDKKIDSNFESLMLAQNLFMENCYRLQKDEPQLETKISEVLEEMINSFNSKTAVAPRDIRKLEHAIKNHDQGVKNALKTLSSILHKSHVTDTKIEDGLDSLNALKSEWNKFNSLSRSINSTNNVLSQKLQEISDQLKHLQEATTNITKPEPNDLTNATNIDRLQKVVDKLENMTVQEVTLNSMKDHLEHINEAIASIENRTNSIGFIFTEHYSRHFKLFLDEYAKNYLRKVNEIFANNTNGINSIKPVILKADVIENINANCVLKYDIMKTDNTSVIDCLRTYLTEDVLMEITIYCATANITSEIECLRKITGTKSPESKPFTESNQTLADIIRSNCFPAIDSRYSLTPINFECLQGILDEEGIEKIRNYCLSYTSEEACLRNISRLGPNENGTIKLDPNITQMVKVNCFTSLGDGNSSKAQSFECIRGILDDEIVEMIRNNCTSNKILTEDECLRYIYQLEPAINITAGIEENIANLIVNSCFPPIDIRVSSVVLISECLGGVLNDSTIGAIRNYCSENMIGSEEDCLRNITAATSVSMTKAAGIVKSKCAMEADRMNCTKGVLDRMTIFRITNYCSLQMGILSEEECLGNLTRIEDDANILTIGNEVKEIIRSKCFPLLDVRDTFNSSSLECLTGILNVTDIQAVRTYCLRNMISSEEACIERVINGRPNITKRDGGRDYVKADPGQVNSTNRIAISSETTTEIDNYQPSEVTDLNDYDDYGTGVY